MAKKSPSDSQPKVVTINRFQIGLNVVIQVVVFATIAVMLNYLSFRHFKRWDFSRDSKYTLTSQTKNLLTSLKKPVKAIIFFSGAVEISPDLNALLREYEYASDKKFSTEVVDPFRNFTRASELSQKYKFGNNENIVILDYDGKSKFVNAADMADFEQPDQMAMMMGQTQARVKAFKGEQAITSALVEITEEKASKIYLVSGHGEPELDSQELKVFAESLKRQNIQSAPLKLLTVNSIPEDARALVICGPKTDFSELEMKLINEFWEKKGRFFVLLNPYARTPRLTAWLNDNGIKPREDRVVRTGRFLSMDPTTGSPQLKTGPVRKATFVVEETRTPITKDLVGISKNLLGETQSIELDRSKEAIAKVQLTPILQSGEGFWGETDALLSEDQMVYFDPKKDTMGPLTLAAAVEKGGVADNRVKVDTSRMIVVGNSDLISNNTYRETEAISIDLTMNGLNWLLDREQLVGIPPREKKSVAITLDEKQLKNLALAVMGLVPGTVAFLGVITWLRRRA